MANNNMGVASINRRMTDFDKAPQKQAFTKVIVVVPDSPSFTLQTAQPADWTTNWTSYFYKSGSDYLNVTGNTAPAWAKNKYYTRSEDTVYTSGSGTAEQTLTVTNPLGTQAMANNIRTALGGWKYQPYTADGSLVTPLAELGDGINMVGTEPLYSGIYKQDTQFSSLCAADVSAPSTEEVDHEYPYVDAATKETDRKFSVLEKSVTSNYSELKQTASSISASVTQVSNEAGKKLNKTESSSSMSWNLTSSGFFINNAATANASNFKLKVNSAGAEINGTVKATAGYIGGTNAGWLIGNKKISTGTAGASGSIHLDAGGATAATIAGTALTNLAICAGANFGVTKTGKLYAAEAEISGKITATRGNIGGWEIGSTYLLKETDGGLNRTLLQASAAPTVNTPAFAVQTRASLSDSWAYTFKVTYGGAVTASNLAITGGSINIGSNFIVKNTGDVTCNSITIKNGSNTVYSAGEYSGSLDGCGGSVSSGLSYSGGSGVSYGTLGKLDTNLSNTVARVGTIEANYVTADWIESTYGSALSGTFGDLTVANNTWSYVDLTVVTSVNFTSKTYGTTRRRFWITEGS